MGNLSDARVYVGTYAKYANGNLSGAWLDLSDYEDLDEFLTACKELHKDEESPEFMFEDLENVPEGFITENTVNGSIFGIIDALGKADANEQEAFAVWCDYLGCDLNEKDAADIIDEFNESYRGQYDTEEDFAREIVNECYDLPEFAAMYFDYAAFARDLFMTDYDFIDGYVFSRL